MRLWVLTHAIAAAFASEDYIYSPDGRAGLGSGQLDGTIIEQRHTERRTSDIVLHICMIGIILKWQVKRRLLPDISTHSKLFQHVNPRRTARGEKSYSLAVFPIRAFRAFRHLSVRRPQLITLTCFCSKPAFAPVMYADTTRRSAVQITNRRYLGMGPVGSWSRAETFFFAQYSSNAASTSWMSP